MEGMNQYFEFQIKLAGRSSEGNGQADQKIFQNVGETPDYIPDIGTMIPIERPQ